MKKKITLTIIYDNTQFDHRLQTDWGFSCLIEIGKNKILFDTGDNGQILLENMKKLGIDPQDINIIFLSHFHHDHTGGLKNFLEINSRVKVFYPHSFPNEIVDIITKSGAGMVPVSEFSEIVPDIFTLGEIQGKIPEQSLALNTEQGLIVITGCAHPGIIDILELAKNKFPDKVIYLVLGGFHLHRMNEEEINDVIQKLFAMDILTVAPTHCSGDSARNAFKEIFGENYLEVGVGKFLEI